MSVSTSSRFNYTVTIKVQDSHGQAQENLQVSLPYPRPGIVNRAHNSTTEYLVRSRDSWHNLAARFFKGRSDLWWVLAEFSGIIDPFTELAEGNTLRIPTFETVMFNTLSFDESATPDIILSQEEETPPLYKFSSPP